MKSRKDVEFLDAFKDVIDLSKEVDFLINIDLNYGLHVEDEWFYEFFDEDQVTLEDRKDISFPYKASVDYRGLQIYCILTEEERENYYPHLEAEKEDA